ncbi:hypothetical protein GIY62_22190 [Burkholderia plantarii]|uniref:hypothetical protein n=1 Tax=Burkholderia plantarii TaxID=41899 RepID=UPI00272DA279|nr:hypothetical protein [Burkholderia plantarii]WLE63059.1 hypothetical protein GIY62_22190 [Burkholderia plantarii]
MKRLLIAVSCVGLLAAANVANAAGCLKGAAVGGVAGHVAGHHAVPGAAAGCAIGHHHAAKKAREARAASEAGDAPHS